MSLLHLASTAFFAAVFIFVIIATIKTITGEW